MFLLLARAVMLLGATAAQGEQGDGARPAPDPSAAEAPTAEAPTVEPDLPAQKSRIESLYSGALVGAKDAEDFAETPGYRQLLEILSQYSEEELQTKAGRRLDWEKAIADPDSWRGEIVRVRALLVGWKAVRFSRPLGEHVDTYRAYIAEADGSEGVVVDFLEPPPPHLEKEDVVDVEAVFFRTVRYESSGQGFFEAPYLIARNLRRLDTEALPRSTAFDGTVKIVIVVAVAYLCIRIINTMRKGPQGKSRSETAEARAARSLRERARAPVPPDPAAPEPESRGL